MTAIAAVRTQPRSLVSSPTLRQGSRGPAVTQLQQKLREKGFNVTVDGVVGPATWSALNTSAPGPAPASGGATPTLRQGSRGAAVSQLQNRLRAHGYNVSVDADFGPATANAVRSFQRAMGLGVDGVVGPATWSALNGGGSVNNPPPATGGARVNGYINGRAVSISVSSVGNGKYMRTDAANAFNRMKADAARAGINLSVVSGFRTMAEQQYLYNLYLQGRGNLAARPGYSNHQGGTSADLSVPGGYGSSTYRWLSANARRYGFVNDVRGEPWHWTFR